MAHHWSEPSRNTEFRYYSGIKSGREPGDPHPRWADPRQRGGADYSMHKTSSPGTSSRCTNAPGCRPSGSTAVRLSRCTLLMSAGAHPKVVQEGLGHATIQLTLDTYSDVVPRVQDWISMAEVSLAWIWASEAKHVANAGSSTAFLRTRRANSSRASQRSLSRWFNLPRICLCATTDRSS